MTHEPSIRLSSFHCPHCGAHAHQDWFELLANSIEKGRKPFFPDHDWFSWIANDDALDAEMKKRFTEYAKRVAAGEVYLQRLTSSKSSYYEVNSLYLSKCYTCEKVAIWIGDRLLHPSTRFEVPPNPDMPPDVIVEYAEAQIVLPVSPRAAAALLRLAIQNLLPHLGVDGDNINTGIKQLVERGLDVRVQRSLDILRVVGNNAVHPGQLDVRDDRETVNQLFHLINLICDHGISQPRLVNALYDRLPESTRKQIDQRDRRD